MQTQRGAQDLMRRRSICDTTAARRGRSTSTTQGMRSGLTFGRTHATSARGWWSIAPAGPSCFAVGSIASPSWPSPACLGGFSGAALLRLSRGSEGVKHLSAEEVREMTGGATTPRAQAAWLAKHGIPFTFNGQMIRVVKEVAEAFELLGARSQGGPRMDLVS